MRKEDQNTYARNRYASNRADELNRFKEYYRKNKDEINARRRAKWASSRRAPRDAVLALIQGAKKRAKARGLAFNLTVSDVLMPEICPILRVPLARSEGAPLANRPSIDRTDSSVGYVTGNVEIVSHRANRLKSNMTLDECRLLLAYLERKAVSGNLTTLS